MIIYTSQLWRIEEIEETLKKYRVKPVAIKSSINFYWPPQPTGVPISILRRLPPDMYAIFKGKNTIVLVP